MAKAEMIVTLDIEALRETVEALYLASGSITAALETLATRLIDIDAAAVLRNPGSAEHVGLGGEHMDYGPQRNPGSSE